METRKHINILIKYLSGECSSSAAEYIKNKLETDVEFQSDFKSLEKLWKASELLQINKGPRKEQLASDWYELKKQMDIVQDGSAKVESAKAESASKPLHKEREPFARLRSVVHGSRISKVKQLMRVAALLALMFGAGYLLAIFLYQDTDLDLAEAQFREISTTRSQLAGIDLIDGSKVKLSVESSVMLAGDFNQTERRLSLTGHAYFDVVSNPDKLFIIENRHAKISVLGTDFTVRAYPDDEFVEVMVAGGTVSLETNGQGVRTQKILTEGNLATLNILTGQISIRDVNPAEHLGWLEGRIVFVETPLSQVVTDLERWFGLTFVLEDESLADRQLTAVLGSRNIGNLIDLISHAMDLEVARYGDEVIIKSK